jgi:hypothetical protein
MIVQEIFTVTGNTDVTDDVIFCRRLEFVGPDAQLVVKPKSGAPIGAQRLLKIVANVIDTTLGGGSGEITFNLDKDYFPLYELPVGDNGLDPETQADKGPDGNPNFNQGPIPLPDIASPNFTILDGFGNYPKATNGGNGPSGGRGGKGLNGSNGPIVEIWTTEIDGILNLDLRGQKGGVGGNGGNGELGGAGQLGQPGATGTDTTWLGVPNLKCNQGPGLGGDGGMGGNAGCGGDGGDGGNGGIVKVFYTSGVNMANIHPTLTKGSGGQPGDPGKPGSGGKAGLPGLNVPPCIPALNSVDGAGGDPCRSDTGDNKGGVSQVGADGQDGQIYTFPVKSIPQVPGLF